MNADVIFSLILAVTLLAVLIGTIRLFRSGRQVLTVAFFAFAIACSLFSTLYWIAYDLLRGDARMPFAANEICEWAQFLLLASSLRATFSGKRISLKAFIPAALFAAANAALWIAWSGEWLQDILTALCLGWLFVVLIDCLLASDALKKLEWIMLGVAGLLLIAVQTLTFFVDAVSALELGGFVLLLAVDAWLVWKTLLALKASDRAHRAICLSFAAYAWSTVAMYMSSGWMYIVMLLLATLCCPLMFFSIRKEVAA